MTSNTRSADGDSSHDKEMVTRELSALATAIQRFRIDTQRFLAGDLPLPPEELIAAIRDDLRRLQARSLKAASESFRLGSLEAQFNSHISLYGKRLRERERSVVAKPAKEQRSSSPPRDNVVIGGSDDRQAIEQLYKGLYPGRQPTSRDYAFEQFGNRLMKQVALIRRKTGCEEIAFRVAEQEGKMKLKARPVRPGGSKAMAKGQRSKS